MILAPIVLFTYNRLWHTQQTVEALQRNEFAKESDLFIYSDGAKDSTSSSKVEELREYLKIINGFKSIKIIERDKNWGLADSIIDGVTDIVNKFGQIIVLEDDIVTSPYFLTFMNDALDFYKDSKKVMNISGYAYPIENEGLKETYLTTFSSCWGWATWEREWTSFDNSISRVKNLIKGEKRKKFQIYPKANIFWRQVIQNEQKIIKSWAIFWYASIFINKGLSLFPKYSLAQNIGFDQSGTHCGDDKFFNVELYNRKITYFETEIKGSNFAFFAMKNYLKKNNVSIFYRVFRKLKTLVLGKCNYV